MIGGICDFLGSGGVEWAVDSGGDLKLAYYDGAIRGWYTGSASNLTAGVWSHVAISWVPGTVKFYVNGQLTNSVATASNVIVYNGDTFDIGHASTNTEWLGLIDDINLYSRELSPQEIATLAEYRGIAYEMSHSPRIIGPATPEVIAALSLVLSPYYYHMLLAGVA
jgi:hypothetical protein